VGLEKKICHPEKELSSRPEGAPATAVEGPAVSASFTPFSRGDCSDERQPRGARTARARRQQEEQQNPDTVIDGQDRKMIYPGKDKRVVRILKKIVCGLSHYRGVESNIDEKRIFADVLRWSVEDEFRASWNFFHCEPDIFKCWYKIFDDDREVSAIWLLTFFEHREFFVRVSAPGIVLEPPNFGDSK